MVVEIGVRYRDLDPLGHVNNAVFLSYLEVARVEYFRRLGLLEASLGAGGAPVVVRAEVDYKRPINYGDLVKVGVRVSRVGRTSFDMRYELRAGVELAALARTVHVLLGASGKPRRIPKSLRSRIAVMENLPVEGL